MEVVNWKSLSVAMTGSKYWSVFTVLSLISQVWEKGPWPIWGQSLWSNHPANRHHALQRMRQLLGHHCPLRGWRCGVPRYPHQKFHDRAPVSARQDYLWGEVEPGLQGAWALWWGPPATFWPSAGSIWPSGGTYWAWRRWREGQASDAEWLVHQHNAWSSARGRCRQQSINHRDAWNSVWGRGSQPSVHQHNCLKGSLRYRVALEAGCAAPMSNSMQPHAVDQAAAAADTQI